MTSQKNLRAFLDAFTDSVIIYTQRKLNLNGAANVLIFFALALVTEQCLTL
jgi:hypothetical protein